MDEYAFARDMLRRDIAARESLQRFRQERAAAATGGLPAATTPRVMLRARARARSRHRARAFPGMCTGARRPIAGAAAMSAG
jgi:hypothetical protein